MPMASHSSIHSLATTNKIELVWHLAHRPELKLSYITICVHRNIMWRGKGKRGENYMTYPYYTLAVYIMHVQTQAIYIIMTCWSDHADMMCKIHIATLDA